jgi:hypothetical protein
MGERGATGRVMDCAERLRFWLATSVALLLLPALIVAVEAEKPLPFIVLHGKFS